MIILMSSLGHFDLSQLSTFNFIYLVNGGFSNWTQWSNCSRQCGLGTRQRFRSCTNPQPQNQGFPCFGPTTETSPCGNPEEKCCSLGCCSGRCYIQALQSTSKLYLLTYIDTRYIIIYMEFIKNQTFYRFQEDKLVFFQKLTKRNRQLIFVLKLFFAYLVQYISNHFCSRILLIKWLEYDVG